MMTFFTSCLQLNLAGTEASNLQSGMGADNEENGKEENGKEEKRSWRRAPLTAFAFTISSAPLLLAEEVKEEKKEEVKEKKMVALPHLNAEDKKKASEEKKMIMGKSQEDRIRLYLERSCCLDD